MTTENHWFTIIEMRTSTDQHVIFDGETNVSFAFGVAWAANHLTKNRIWLGTGKGSLGRMVSELPAITEDR
jgi:hypothetical protein